MPPIECPCKRRLSFFIDADIRLQPTTIEHTLSLVKKRNASLLTGFPHFPTTSVLSKLLVPMQHFLVLFHLPLVMANLTRRPAFTAAHGAFMFFHHDAYKKIGGHKAVQSSLVEDVALAKEMKRSKETVILANITHEVSCYMYETNKEVWNGFAKNAFPGIGRSYLLALGISMFYITTFVSPLALAFIGLFTSQLLYVIPLLLIWTLKAYIDWTTNQKNGLFFLMPFSALMLVIMLHYSIFLALRKKGYEWKGRRYS
nr:glycosyltransferase family 2 protein [Halalkalibacter wakoensis]